jgi:VPDSG-CTERM motif
MLERESANKHNQSNTMKNPSKTILALVTIGLFSSGLFCQQALATPITGDITFAGVVTFDNTDLSLAKEVSTNFAIVLSHSLDFNSVPLFTSVTVFPWIFSPSMPTTPLWTVGSFSFDLTSSTIVSQTDFFLNVTGVGTLSGPGFDPTPGTWSFTVANALGRTNETFGFQSDTAAGLVPDGGTTAALLGLALAGIEVLRRKFKAA